MSVEELVHRLHRQQEMVTGVENTGNSNVSLCRVELEIKEAKGVLAALESVRDDLKAPFTSRIAEIEAEMERTKTQIIEAWDGDKRTVRHDGTIHIYVNEKDSGMRIELDADGVLEIHPGEARWRMKQWN